MHVVTTTTHKSLRGPRGGLILTNDEEISKKVNRALPGHAGRPLMHVIASKAVAFGERSSQYKAYQRRRSPTLRPRRALVEHGYRITSGGTTTSCWSI